MWKYLCLTWILTKEWTQPRGILIIKWMGWPFLWTPVSLFTLILSSSLSRLVSKVVGTEACAQAWKHGLPFTERDLAMASNCPVCRKQRLYWALEMEPFSEVLSHLLGGRLTTLDCFHHGIGSIVYLSQYRETSEILWVWFQTSAARWISQKSESHEFFGFPVQIKVCPHYIIVF